MPRCIRCITQWSLIFSRYSAKVDILIVSVTADKFIFKGPSQPYNNEINRANFKTYK